MQVEVCHVCDRKIYISNSNESKLQCEKCNNYVCIFCKCDCKECPEQE